MISLISGYHRCSQQVGKVHRFFCGYVKGVYGGKIMRQEKCDIINVRSSGPFHFAVTYTEGVLFTVCDLLLRVVPVRQQMLITCEAAVP